MNIFKYLREKLCILYFRMLPIDKQMVVFWDGVTPDGFGDNIKPLYYEFKKRYPNYKYVFIVNSKDKIKNFPIREIAVKSNYLKYKYLCRAKYYITNMHGLDFKRRKKQIWVDTGHGAPVKTIGFMEKSCNLDEKTKRKITKQESDFTHKTLQNQFSIDNTIKGFSCNKNKLKIPKEIFYITGSPRNDILFNINPNFIIETKEKLGIKLDKKVILYAPTYRGDSCHAKSELPFDIELLEKELKNNYVLLSKSHYFLDSFPQLKDIKNTDFSIDVSKYPNISDLYQISDILITDYSSAAMDYSCLNRPIIFYCYDYEKYKNERGLNMNIEKEAPGAFVSNQVELINAIRNIHQLHEQYQEKYKQYKNNYSSIEDGNSAKRIIDLIME